MSENKNNMPQSDSEITGIAAYFIRNKVISWMISLIFLIGGLMAFFGLGRLKIRHSQSKMQWLSLRIQGLHLSK